MSPLLEARRVRKIYHSGTLFGARTGTIAVDDFSLAIREEKPSFITIAGESGSGKTTIARLLLGFTDPTEGEVRYRGKELRQLSRQERRVFRQEVQAIFQDPFEVYNPFYKVDHLLTTPIAKFGLAASQAQAREMIVQALEAVGLRPDETLGRYPHQLSGGQRQRITIARALLLKSRLIIADEPVSMVDASLRATILESLHRLYQDFGISFLYITHDLTTAYQISESILILYQGGVVEAGEVGLVIRDPRHPYTRELIHAIPVPDPGSAWIDTPIQEKQEGEMTEEEEPLRGCRYLPRCPHAMPRCRQPLLGLFRTDRQRGAACYLYEEAPVVGTGDLMSLLQQEKCGEGSL